MRSPRFTRVSDGKPLRRLLVISKKWAVLIERMVCHTASGFKVCSLSTRRRKTKRSRQQADVITTALRLLVVGNAEFSQLAPRKLTLCHATDVASINVVRIGTANHYLFRKIKPPRTISLREVLREWLHAAFKPAAV